MNDPRSCMPESNTARAGTPELAPSPTLSSRFSELQEPISYPVMTLPNEIVSEIFIQYLPHYPACPPLLGDGSPTKLGQICRHWREVAHATPMLWRAMTLFMSRASLAACVLQLDTAKAWLERSRALPLSILMGNKVPDAARHLRDGALDHLMAHRTRWEYLMLHLPPSDNLISRKCIEGAMPLLLELDLQFDGYISRLDATIGTVDMPRLHTAFLDCSDVKNLRQVLLPWAHLTKLFLDFVDTGAAALTLHKTMNLVHCRLTFSHKTSWGGDILHLPQLETLIVGTNYPPSEGTHGLLLLLRTPVLRGLSIKAATLVSVTQPNEHLTLASVISAFGCKLERLCVERSTKSLEEYTAAFPQVPHIDLVMGPGAVPDDYWGSWDLSDLSRSRT
ncbi:hypothetical protein C8F01DRAFT_6492 [Mycena amicta]|nr:hypothetical protein C8F01DRAFT_6492 [Mycena amicta]